MALARQRSEWLRTAALVMWVPACVWGKERIDATRVIPPQFRPPVPPEPPKTPEQRASESRFAWNLLDRFFGGK